MKDQSETDGTEEGGRTTACFFNAEQLGPCQAVLIMQAIFGRK